MATYVTLQFNDGEIKLSTSSFLFKQSKLLQAFNIEEDTTYICGDSFADNNIPIICSKTYITKNNANLFDDKPDLLFMFTLQPNKFLDVCKFLDIICYENEDTLVRTQFIKYVMTTLKEKINIIKYFMQPEIRSIMNYINKENADIQIRTCTPEFYHLYLTEYKEEVIKHNRTDIFEYVQNKDKYYRHIHKYNNQLTYIVKETLEYNVFIENINSKLINSCCISKNINKIKKLAEQGANINLQDNKGYTALHYAAKLNNNLEVMQYLVENGANINLQNNFGSTALHFASQLNNNLEAIQCLVENGALVNLQNNYGYAALHHAAHKRNNLEVIQYLVEQGANINLQNNNGKTALHVASQFNNNLKVIQYLVENGANVNLQNNNGKSALHFASYKNNLKVIQYLIEHDADVNLQNNRGYTALDIALLYNTNDKAINYLQSVTQK